jgi:hypothetical protein
MKAKVFDIVSHRLAGETPPEALEKKLNDFLREHPGLQVHSTHLSSVVLPSDATAMRGSEAAEPSIIIFFALFYSE